MPTTTPNGAAEALHARTITRTLVPESRRSRFLPQLFPGRIRGLPGFLWGEAQLYDVAKKLCPDYRGGFWSFYRLSNTGLYAAPEMECATVTVRWADNFFDGEMSPDAFGIVATLFALSAACCVSQSDLLAGRYDTLRDFAAEHDERNLIFRAID
ncbi:antirestriction protein [Kozakia baliensis]|uniref:antirestriction protein n=1 Tax=Kozakia baliensis TaxID=153496 RepID=UPI0008793044|nr:antirestriction protein [Kozakia baliensis]AOX21527.1 hypothetical protein A0U90_13570 [Kozakia baliensis]